MFSAKIKSYDNLEQHFSFLWIYALSGYRGNVLLYINIKFIGANVKYKY